VQRGYLDLKEITTIRVPKATLQKLRLLPGDILFNEGGDRDKLGRGWVWEGQVPDCIHQNHVFRARVRLDEYDPKFMSMYGNSLGRKWFEDHGKQTVNLASISLSTLKTLPVPLIPLYEQQKIVAAIEEQFSRVDAGAAALARARQNLKLMRDACYAEAVAGLSDNLIPRIRLGDVLREPLRNGHSAKADPNGTVPIITLGAVTLGDFGARNLKMTAADPRRVRGLWLQPGDLLIERSNTRELVGTACLYRGVSDFAVYPDLIIRARLDHRIMPEYAELAL
jgi:hypothetical protein